MSDCPHASMTLTRKKGERVVGGNGLPRQVTFYARCDECNKRITVDYNIAFIDGEKA